MLGQPERAVHERSRSTSTSGPDDSARVGILELNLGVQAYADGRWNEAVDCTSAPSQTARRRRPPHAAIATTNHGELLVSRGRLAEAEPSARGGS